MAIVCRTSLSAQLWAAITKCHRLGGLNKINLFSHSTGSHKSAIREPAWSGSCEVSLPGLHMAAILLWTHMQLMDCGLTSKNILLSGRPYPNELI